MTRRINAPDWPLAIHSFQALAISDGQLQVLQAGRWRSARYPLGHSAVHQFVFLPRRIWVKELGEDSYFTEATSLQIEPTQVARYKGPKKFYSREFACHYAFCP